MLHRNTLRVRHSFRYFAIANIRESNYQTILLLSGNNPKPRLTFDLPRMQDVLEVLKG